MFTSSVCEFEKEAVMLLEYVIEATKDIITLMLILGMMFAYARNSYNQHERKIFKISIIASVAASIWMAVMKNSTNLINTSAWNLRIYIITFAAFAVFIIFTAVESNLSCKDKSLKIPVAAIALSVYAFLLIFIISPDFFAYPYSLKVAETTIFSSSYILKLSGVVIGFVLTLVASFSVDRMGRRLGRQISLVLLIVMMCINQVKQLGSLFASLQTNRIISNDMMFSYAVYTLNHEDLFIYLTFVVACTAAIIMLVKSARVKEPYSNPAQHRKIRARWRMIRRWAATSISTVIIAVLLMTVIDSVVNAEVEIAPTQDAVIANGCAVVGFEEVSDGHLHRYGYVTENDIEVRFIVIKKPNSTSYGVGMDCCDICGETGYYENNAGDVVCSRCDVIMNINTIGFKGGCNPKVIDYTVENNQIIIPLDQLIQYEDDFAAGRGTGSAK